MKFFVLTLSIFCQQPQPPQDPEYIDYDSADSAESETEEEEEDVFDGSTAGNEAQDKDNTEHSNPGSFAWSVMRLGMVQIVERQLKDFLTTAGIELQGKLTYLYFREIYLFRIMYFICFIHYTCKSIKCRPIIF
jgi:hypothetical protein